jgi:hypothetical protein
MKKLFLFTLMILTACVPAQPQVTVTSKVTVTCYNRGIPPKGELYAKRSHF